MERTDFDIPFLGLKDGKHVFTYEIGEAFFKLFENPLIGDGDIYIQVELEKKPSLMTLSFFGDGLVNTHCDRCLDDIDLQINFHESIYLKFKENPVEAADENIAYISPRAHKVNVAQFIYEFISLQLPAYKTCELNAGRVKKCDPKMLAYLKEDQEKPASEEKTSGDPRWDILEKLK